MDDELPDRAARRPRASPDAADRVRRSHHQTRATVRLALSFAVAAAVAAVVTLWRGDRWLPLHLFLAGAVVLAISGVSLMLTVTWSAAPAPSDRSAAMQRWAVAVGAAGVAVGRAGGLPHAVVDTAGSLYLAGLVGLAVLLVRTARRGVERRFDPAVAAYLAALAAGLAGVAIGIAMAAGSPTPQLRATHATVNLLGLVGLVVSGTLPFFAATVGRSRMSPRATRARLAAALVWQVATLAVGAAGLAADSGTVGAIGLVAYALGVLLTLDSVPRPTRRQLNWAGPRLVGLWAGTVWWAVAVAATAVDAAAGRPVLSGRWLLVLVIAGYGQVLWGSLAYLLPMLRGGGHRRLGEGFGVTRSWPGLAAVNVAGACLATALSDALAAAAVAVWAVDAAWRAARVGTTRAQRPDPEEGHAVTT